MCGKKICDSLAGARYVLPFYPVKGLEGQWAGPEIFWISGLGSIWPGAGVAGAYVVSGLCQIEDVHIFSGFDPFDNERRLVQNGMIEDVGEPSPFERSADG